MPGSWDPTAFPNLTAADHAITSPATRTYNCIAWAADDITAKWWPDQFGIGKWPPNTPRAETIDAFILAYGTLGYVPCTDGNLEKGFEKVAIYANREVDGSLSPTHAARQFANGNWTSKLGDFEDIEHYSLSCLDSAIYGRAVVYLRRPRAAP